MTKAQPTLAARRAFLRAGKAVSAPPRPPGSGTESEFLDACSRCGACSLACPEGIVLRGDGGYPVLDFQRGECSFCARCIDSCQPGALLHTLLESWAWRARINSNCLTHAGVVCQSCRDACPSAAIGFPPQLGVATPRLSLEACSGCGACVAACPAAAISMQQHAGAPVAA